MERGYVKLWRKTLDSGLIQHPTALQVFTYLLLKTTYKPHKLIVGSSAVCLEAGQVLAGRKSIAQECKLSEQNVRTALKLLENMEILTIKSTKQYSVISFVNWDSYQQDSSEDQPTDQPKGNQDLTKTQPKGNHKQERNKERKKEEENIKTCSHPILGDEPEEPALFVLPTNKSEQYPVFKSDVDRWQGIYPAVNVEQEIRNMIGWCEGHQNQRKTWGGMAKFITGWLAREQNRGSSSRQMQLQPAPRLSWQEEKEKRDLEAFLNDTPRPWEVQHG